MTIHFLKPFIKDYTKLPDDKQKKVDRLLNLLKQDLYHPGLNARKMTGKEQIWEARVDVHYRMTFKIEGELLVMRRVGTHEIYRRP